ncbi:MAG: hypothetical protein H6573_19280 [Lewinellaceae bacterium]|nr:hypothetical protein [Phaeodactylibacter sp.]MCB9349631.1 hypothetical protein [Lewinellaceae bacterium]
MFDDKSRYRKLELYRRIDRRGREVPVVPVPEAPEQALLGYHRRLQGQRIDHLAATYLKDPAGFWRICEFNDAMLPEALAEETDIAIPNKTR